jgi:hypothetical protein
VQRCAVQSNGDGEARPGAVERRKVLAASRSAQGTAGDGAAREPLASTHIHPEVSAPLSSGPVAVPFTQPKLITSGEHDIDDMKPVNS